jgi:hypothetical protein
MRRILACFTAAAFVAGSLAAGGPAPAVAAPAPANVATALDGGVLLAAWHGRAHRHFRHHYRAIGPRVYYPRRYYGGGYRYRPYYGGYGPYYGDHYPYYRPDPGAAIAAGIIGLAAGAIAHQARPRRHVVRASSCSALRGYSPRTHTFIGRDGRRHYCR